MIGELGEHVGEALCSVIDYILTNSSKNRAIVLDRFKELAVFLAEIPGSFE